jgi:hypothetical protein
LKLSALKPLSWHFVLSWLILGYGIVSFVSVSIFSYRAPEYVSLWQRLINPLLQLIFVVAAVQLLRREVLAVPLFTLHLIASFLHTAYGAPQLVFTPAFLAKWILSFAAFALALYRWRLGVLWRAQHSRTLL